MSEQCLDGLFWLCQGSEYAVSKFHWVQNMPLVLNARAQNLQGCEFVRVTHAAEYASISMNMP